MPKAEPTEGQFLVTPIYHVFGSDELSSQSWPIAERSSAPVARLNPVDAQRLNIEDGLGVYTNENPHDKYEVELDAAVAIGSIGLSRGFPNMRYKQATKVEIFVDPEYEPRPRGSDRILAKE